jgi:hypothetical protein
MAALEKVFSCMTCGAQIKLERKSDNSSWIKYNLDGSQHVDERKSKKQQPQAVTVDNDKQIAELTKRVFELKETVNVLISQIQMLRSDVKKAESISE